jgi:hypothetical protein
MIFDQAGKFVFSTSIVVDDASACITDLSTKLTANGLYYVNVRRAQNEQVLLPFYFQSE